MTTMFDRRRFFELAGMGVTAGVMAGCGFGSRPVRRFTFSVTTRGRVWANIEEFANHALGTLNAFSGWSLGGSAAFQRLGSGGDFTLWLCEARLVPSFSSICSSMWSCRVGRDVIINQDRWLGGTATWPYGLNEYRHYVVNHERGHWLGLGHWASPGPGRYCPVMFQQSKGIVDGSIYNTWPLRAEKQFVSNRWGIPLRDPR